jgi:hypothetical protein
VTDQPQLVHEGEEAIDRFLAQRGVRPARQGPRRVVAVALDGGPTPDGDDTDGDDTGDAVAPATGTGERLQLSLESTARSRGVLARLVSSRSVPRDRWPAALMACNHWNRRQPVARAVLVTGPERAAIVVEGWLPSAESIPDEQVARLVGGVVAVGRRLWSDPRLRAITQPPA